MSKPLRVLVVQDSEEDASIWLRELSQGGFELTAERVQTESTFVSALEGAHWDLILAENQLAEFNALAALKSIQEKGLDLPFIIVSQARDVEVAVAALKAGAHDYVLKSSLSCLAPAVEQALREADTGRTRRRAEESLRLSENRLRAIIVAEPECVKVLSLDGRLLEINPAGLRMLEAEELSQVIGQFPVDLVAPEHRALFRDLHQCVARGESGTLEYEMVGLKGNRRWLDTHAVPLRNERQEVVALLGISRDITKRKLAEERNDNILRTAMDGFWVINMQGDILEVNDAYCRLSGYSREELLAMNVRDVEAAEGAAEIAGRIQKVKDSGQERFETRHRRKDGRLIELEVSAKFLAMEAGRFFSFFRDITEHKQIEEALRESEMKTRAILDNAADGIMTADERGRIESFNPAAAQTFGYEPSEVIGQNIRLLIPRPYLREHESYIALASARGTSKILNLGREVIGRHKDGRTFPLDLAVSEVWLGEKRLFIAVVRDITERKQAQDALANSREQLRSLAAHVESVREEERTRMAREVHDVLGQSLTGLKMDLAWLSARLPGGPEALLERTRSMSELTDETIQTVRKIASDLRPGVLDNLGLVAAIEWQAEDFQARTGIECACQAQLNDAGLAPELSTAVFRIFQETLTNVARHAGAAIVTVRLNETAGQLVLAVQDNGRGIDESEKTNPKSLGLLGMRERAFLLGGAIRITGAPGQGTQVTLTIPLTVMKTTAGQR